MRSSSECPRRTPPGEALRQKYRRLPFPPESWRTGRTPIRINRALRLACILLLVPAAAGAADQDVVRLQRDVASLGDRVRTLQQSMDQQLASIAALVQQTLDRVNQVQAADGVLQKAFADRAHQQQQQIAGPVQAMDAKLDHMTSQFTSTRDGVADLATRMRDVEAQLAELSAVVRIIQSPRPAPPSGAEALGGPPPGVTAQGLFQQATGDQMAGRDQQALQEYSDYLRYFDNTELVAGSRFHIAEIAFQTGKLGEAMQVLDTILEEYPKSGAAPNAIYLKTKVLEKQGKRTAATREANRLIRLYPNSDAANRMKKESATLRKRRTK